MWILVQIFLCFCQQLLSSISVDDPGTTKNNDRRFNPGCFQMQIRLGDFKQHAHTAHLIAVQQVMIFMGNSVGRGIQNGIQIGLLRG